MMPSVIKFIAAYFNLDADTPLKVDLICSLSLRSIDIYLLFLMRMLSGKKLWTVVLLQINMCYIFNSFGYCCLPLLSVNGGNTSSLNLVRPSVKSSRSKPNSITNVHSCDF